MANKTTKTLVNEANALVRLLKREVGTEQAANRGLHYAMNISSVLYSFKTKAELSKAAKYVDDHAAQLREHLENMSVLESSMSGDNSVYLEATEDLKYSRNLLCGTYRVRAKALENVYNTVQDISRELDWSVNGKMPDSNLMTMVKLLEDARQDAGYVNNKINLVLALRKELWKKVKERRRVTDNYSFELTR